MGAKRRQGTSGKQLHLHHPFYVFERRRGDVGRVASKPGGISVQTGSPRNRSFSVNRLPQISVVA